MQLRISYVYRSSAWCGAYGICKPHGVISGKGNCYYVPIAGPCVFTECMYVCMYYVRMYIRMNSRANGPLKESM